MQKFKPSQQSYAGGYSYNPFATYKCIWVGAKDSNSDDSVTGLVNALHDKGYAPKNQPRIPTGAFAPKIDVMFDPNIRDAVIRLQQANNIKADGVVGPDTWKLLGVGGWTGINLANCPRCAGQYPFGESPPYDCTSNRPPTQQELVDRAAKAEEITGTTWVPGGGQALPPPDDKTPSKDGKGGKKQTDWLLVGGIGLLAVGAIAGGVVWYRKQRAM
jgi:hypothetical protein